MRKKILIVDDDPGVRKVILRLFQDDYDTQTAEDGRLALDLLRKTPPDLLLLDIDMPRMDGLAVLRAAKHILPALRVLMLTGNPDIAIARDALNFGALAYITKPFAHEDFRNEVVRLLEPCREGEKNGNDCRPWRIAQTGLHSIP